MQIMGQLKRVGSNQRHCTCRPFTGAVGARMIQFNVNSVLCLFCLSTFGRVEVYNLNPNKVSTLQAWVMHDLADSRYRLLLGTHILSGLF